MRLGSRKNIVFFILVLVVAIVFAPSAYSYERVGYEEFDWYIKEAPPSGSPNYPKARITRYYYSLESDWPVWYTGAKGKGTSCTVPKSQMGFYESVRCEGTGITNDGKLVSHTGIKPIREESKLKDISERLKYIRPPPRPKRTIAVILNKDSLCYIPRYSRVYIKFPNPNHPHTGWYVAEDTGGGFKGKEPYCKIDIFTGIGKQDGLGKNPTVSKTDESKWPEIWVYPGKNTPDLKEDNIITYLMGKPSTGLPPGAAGIPSGAYAGAPSVSALPTHPYFNVPYSIDPSFKVEAEFDFSLYETVPERLGAIERCRDDLDCITGMVVDTMEDTGVLWFMKYAGNVISEEGTADKFYTSQWLTYCEDPESYALTSIAEAIETIKTTSDSDCYLPVHVPSPVQSGIMEEPTSTALRVLLGIATLGISELVGDWESEPPIISFVRSGTGIKILMKDSAAEAQTVEGLTFHGVDTRIRGDSYRDLKYSPSLDEIYVFRGKRNISIYPKEGAPTSDICAINNKIVKFCIVQDDSVLVYDEGLNKLGMKNLVMKFAYLFKSEVTDVEGLEVIDAKYASNKSIVAWDELLGVDVNFYTIFYSENPGVAGTLKTISPAEARQDDSVMSEIKTIDLPIDSMMTVLSVDLHQEPFCEVGGLTPQTCFVEYLIPTLTSAEDIPVEFYDETLYYAEEDRKFFYFLPGTEDNQKYFFAITATDTDGVESPSFSIVEDDVYEQSVKDLPPGLAFVNDILVDGDQVTINIEPIDYYIDESYMDLAEVEHYKIFCTSSLASDIDLLQRPSFFESGWTELDDGSIELLVDLSNFNEVNCIFDSTPAEVAVVVAGVSKDGITDVYYNGRATPISFSEQTLMIQ